MNLQRPFRLPGIDGGGSPSGPTAGLLYIDWNQNSGVVDTGEPNNQYDAGETDWDKMGAGGTAPAFVNNPSSGSPYEGTYCVIIDGFGRGIRRGSASDVSTPEYALPDGDWTIRLPFQQNGSPAAARRRMFGLWNTSGNERSWWITKESDNTILFQTSSNGSTTTTTCDSADNSWSLTANTWHDLTLQRNGTQVTMVIDDVVQSVGTLSNGTYAVTGANSLRWGTDQDVPLNRAFKGWFDATGIWEGAAYSEITGSQIVGDTLTMPAIAFIVI